MPAVYDNWERLVAATLKREQYRELALAPSPETSFNSSISSTFTSISLQQSTSLVDYVPGSLMYRLIKAAEDAGTFKQECAELRSKAETLLRKAARVSNIVYDRPTRRIIVNSEQVLEKTLALLLKCGSQGIRRVFYIIPADAFGKMSSQLENCIRDVSWLLSISISSDSAAGEEEYLGVPPIASTEPLLCLIWEQIGVLYTGSLEARSDAAAVLLFLARENDQSRKLIIEEGGVRPLLNLVNEGKLEGQENAVRAIGWLGNDSESVEHIIDAGACGVFVKMLKQGRMKVQAAVAWAVSELATYYPSCQDLFLELNIIWSLAIHLAFDTIFLHIRAMEMEDRTTIAHLKAMAARALCHLSKGNSLVCRRIAETSVLLSLATLLGKGPEEAQYNSAMALMEITAVAEHHDKLRRSAFNPNSRVRKLVVEELIGVVEMEARDSKLLIPCIKAIGNLARSFKLNETRIICPLLKLMDPREIEISREVCIALTKFACSDNFLCPEYSEVIIDNGGLKRLIELVYSREEIVQSSALILLCYVAVNAAESEKLSQERVVDVLEWASKQSLSSRDQYNEDLIPLAMERFELHRSRGTLLD